MIRLIGLKRVIVLAVLLAINLSAAGAYFLGFAPMLEETRTQLNRVDGQISELRGKIAALKQESAFLEGNLSKYQELKEGGLFMDQNRFTINRLLQDMRGKAEIPNFSFTIENSAKVPNADAESMGYNLVSSRINVEKIVSPLDSNIYVFLQNIGSAFPQHTRLEKFYIKRVADVNERTLSDIVEGRPAGFVSANIYFDWMTLAPKSAGQPAGSGGH